MIHSPTLPQVQRALWVALIANILVAIAKLVVGLLIGSLSMVADAFHSAMDSSSNIIGLFATRIAARPPDQNHPYGHRKAETFATFAIAVLLALACWEILSQAIARVHTPTPVQANLPSLIVMAVTIVINLAVSRYESERAKTLRSDLLTADAAQTRSDVFVSLSVLLSLAAASLGFAWVDIVMALVIAVLLGRTAYQIVLRSVAVLTDEAALDPRRIEQVVLSVPGVVLSHHIRSRGPADDIAIDLHVHVDPHLSLEQAHRITHQVTQALQQQFPGVRDVVVHLEPRRRTADEERDLFERVRDVVTNLHGSVRASAHNIRIQEVAGKLEVDLHLELEGEPTVEQAHEMASDLEKQMTAALPSVSTVTSHLEPTGSHAQPIEATVVPPAEQKQLMDALDQAVKLEPGIVSVHHVRLRSSHGHLSVSLHAVVDGTLPLATAHAWTTELEARLRISLPDLGEIVVHLEPVTPERLAYPLLNS